MSFEPTPILKPPVEDFKVESTVPFYSDRQSCEWEEPRTILIAIMIIFDHVSAQWASDENMSIRPGSHSGDNVYDVTFQRCIIGPTLYPHSTGSYACPGHAWNKDKQNKEKGLYVQDIYFKIECMIFRNSDCDR